MINKKYLNKEAILLKLNESNLLKPIKYIIFDDFIEEDFYKKCILDFDKNGYNLLSIESGKSRLNKSIFIPGENLYKLNNFLKSEFFENYLSIFFGNKLEREFYVKDEDILERTGNEKGLLGQIYEKGDYYSWHIDGYEKGVSLGTFVYYLNGYNDENCTYGGELELGQGSWGNITGYKKITPKNNRLILLFYSEIAFHRVLEVTNKNLKRISVQATLIKK